IILMIWICYNTQDLVLQWEMHLMKLNKLQM
ncbi:putative phosphatase, partial [Haemophilus influenzae]